MGLKKIYLIELDPNSDHRNREHDAKRDKLVDVAKDYYFPSQGRDLKMTRMGKKSGASALEIKEGSARQEVPSRTTSMNNQSIPKDAYHAQ